MAARAASSCDRGDLLQPNVGLRANLHSICKTRQYGFDFAFGPWVVGIYPFKWQQLIEIFAVRLAVSLEVGPLPGDVAAGMEDDDSLIENMARGVLLDHAHDPADELHEGREIAEDTEDCGNRKEAMVKALTQLANLNDDVKLVVFQPLHDALIGDTSLARMHIVGPAPTGAVGFNDLLAMVVVERRCDDLQAIVAGLGAQALELADGGVDDRVQRLP